MKPVIKNSTRERLLDAGILVAREEGYMNVTVCSVACEAGVATGTVHHHFQTIEEYKDELIAYAIHTHELQIVAQALVLKHRFTTKLPKALREQALESLR